ncbi:PDR/VanB family oxidoreductase [Millisia brevis]|uniref:PDR/VanB family oxidoreductase n=1 Tax=Millisia brevis TaxID=264148 RepID=UPI00082ACED2|nr:PDR/VanB family oxidoreductase [Millisia brevis]
MTASPASAPGPGSLTVEVIGIERPADGIRQLRLAAPDRRPLPSFVPGSSILVTVPPEHPDEVEVVRAYTLIGPAFEPDAYAIAVREIGAGSRRIHRLTVGRSLTVSLPRSGFAPVLAAPEHLLIAGGIGVTPILAHARWHHETGGRITALHVHQPGRDAYRDDLRMLTAGRVTHLVGRGGVVEELERLIGEADPAAHLYTCGPDGLVRTVEEVAERLGVTADRVHSELFTTPERPSEPFTVDLRNSGRSIEVAADQSLLEALEAAGVDVDSQCRRGVCGRCCIPVSGGSIDHRDLYLSARERAAGTEMMPCVSRALGPALEVAL